MRWKRAGLVGWAAVIVVSLTLGSIAHQVATRVAKDRVESDFTVDAQILRDGLHLKLQRAVGVVESARSFFDSSVHVDANEFETFALDILKQEPWIVALEWAPRVSADALAAHEEQVRSFGEVVYRAPDSPAAAATGAGGRAGYKVFPVDDGDEDAGLAGQLARYPVVYVVPFDASVVGLDLASETSRRSALMECARTGESRLTSPIQLVQLGEEEAGALIFAAVREQPVVSPSWHEEPLLGVVLGVMHYSSLIAHAKQVFPTLNDDVSYWLYDQGAAEGADALMLGSNTDMSHPATVWFDSAIEVAGRSLQMRAIPGPGYVSARFGREPMLAALVFTLASMMVGCAFSRVLARVRRAATRNRDSILHSVLRSLAEGVVVVDRDANIIFCNRVAHEMLGPIESTPPQDWTSVCGLYKEDAKTPFPIEQLPLVRGMHGERVGFQHVFVRNEENPEGAWLSISGSPWLDDEERLQGGIAVIRDVSDRRQIQSEMRLMAVAAEQVRDVVFITTLNGVVTYVNPAFERVTGWTSEEVVGKTPRLIATDEGEAALGGSLWTSLHAQKTFRGTLASCRKDGSTFTTTYTVTPVHDPAGGGPHLVFVGLDVPQESRSPTHSV